MKLLTRILVFFRYVTLNRQMQEMKRNIQSMPVSVQRAAGQLAMKEIDAAAQTSMPHLYGSSSADAQQLWGDGAAKAFKRSRSRVPQLKLRGTALWLAIVYQETIDSPHSSMQSLHRDILGLLGHLKGTYANPNQVVADGSF